MPKTLGRTLWIFALLVFAVWSWQWFENSAPAGESGDSTLHMAETESDYYLQDFKITNVDNAAGQIYQLSGQSLSHDSNDGSSSIARPLIKVFGANQKHWQGSAQQGDISPDFRQLALFGAVTLAQFPSVPGDLDPALARSIGKASVEITSASVKIDTTKQPISTYDPVTITLASTLSKSLRNQFFRSMCCLLLLGFATSALTDTRTDANQPINVQADQSDFDEKAGIQTLKGNVEITQGSLAVKADSIQIELKNGTLFRIIGRGKPIVFQQQTDSGAIMRGQSNRIEYNMQTTQITFSGDARFERPGQKLSGNSIMYNMSALTFKASGDSNGRVNIVLQPNKIKR